MHQQQTAFRNIVGKEEIARNEQFLLFPLCFLLDQKIVSLIVNIFDIISLFAAEMEEPKIMKCGKGLGVLKSRISVIHVIVSEIGVLHGSVVKCSTCNPGVLGSSGTRSSGFFVGVPLGKTLQSPSLVLVKPRKDMNNVSYCRDITEILLKAV